MKNSNFLSPKQSHVSFGEWGLEKAHMKVLPFLKGLARPPPSKRPLRLAKKRAQKKVEVLESFW